MTVTITDADWKAFKDEEDYKKKLEIYKQKIQPFFEENWETSAVKKDFDSKVEDAELTQQEKDRGTAEFEAIFNQSFKNPTEDLLNEISYGPEGYWSLDTAGGNPDSSSIALAPDLTSIKGIFSNYDVTSKQGNTDKIIKRIIEKSINS